MTDNNNSQTTIAALTRVLKLYRLFYLHFVWILDDDRNSPVADAHDNVLKQPSSSQGCRYGHYLRVEASRRDIAPNRLDVSQVCTNSHALIEIFLLLCPKLKMIPSRHSILKPRLQLLPPKLKPATRPWRLWRLRSITGAHTSRAPSIVSSSADTRILM